MKNTKTEPKFLWRILFSLLFIVPLVYSNVSIDWIIPLRSVITAALIVITGFYAIRKKLVFPTGFLKNKSFLLLLLYILTGFFSYFSVINKSEFFASSSYKLLLPLLITTIYFIFNSIEKPVEKVSQYIIYSSFIFIFISLTQATFNFFAFVPATFLGSSTFANINMLSTAVIMSIPFSVFGIYKFGMVHRITAYCNIFMAAYTVTFLRTRSVWVAAILSSITTLVLLMIARKKSNFKLLNRKTITILILIVSAIIIAVTAYVIIDKYFPDFGATQRMKKDVLGGSTVSVRLNVWKKSLGMIKDHPLLGVGNGNWSLRINEYGTAGMRSERGEFSYKRPHNDYVWIASENGIPALIIYMLFLLSVYFTGISKLLKADKMNWEIVIALFGLKAYGIVALFSFPGERVFNLILLAIFCVIILKSNEKTEKRSFEKYPWLVFTMISLIFAGVSISRFQSDVYMRKIADSRQEIDQLRVAAAQKRIPGHTADLKINTLRSNIIKYADNAYTPVYSIDPSMTHVLAYKAKMLFDMGKYKESVKVYNQTLKEHPCHFYTLFSTALTYDKLRNSSEEMRIHKRILELAPKFPGTLLELSAKSAHKNETDEAYNYFKDADKKINIVRYNSIAMMLTEQYLKKNEPEKARMAFNHIEGDIPVPKYKELKNALNTLTK